MEDYPEVAYLKSRGVTDPDTTLLMGMILGFTWQNYGFIPGPVDLFRALKERDMSTTRERIAQACIYYMEFRCKQFLELPNEDVKAR